MEQLAALPPMGWNAWNYFGYSDVNEKVIYETADAMIAQGFRDAGYNYVCVDDTWMVRGRDENGDVVYKYALKGEEDNGDMGEK